MALEFIRYRDDFLFFIFLHEFCIKHINEYSRIGYQDIDITGALMKQTEFTKFERRHSQNKTFLSERDSRKHPRRTCNQPLFFLCRHRNFKGRATNISRGGAFVETASKIALGEQINLVIHKSQEHKRMRVMGWIVRLGRKGVGISFNRRFGRERRYDLDRRTGLDRRTIEPTINPSDRYSCGFAAAKSRLSIQSTSGDARK
jgi:hypothetical protein